MTDLFVSFIGNLKGLTAHGWVVLDKYEAIVNGAKMESLCRYIEEIRGYDRGTIVVLNFRRLETVDGGNEQMTFRWETATAHERAEMIRGHQTGSRPLSDEQTCDVFGLTLRGLRAIQNGANWRPEFER